VKFAFIFCSDKQTMKAVIPHRQGELGVQMLVLQILG